MSKLLEAQCDHLIIDAEKYVEIFDTHEALLSPNTHEASKISGANDDGVEIVVEPLGLVSDPTTCLQ